MSHFPRLLTKPKNETESFACQIGRQMTAPKRILFLDDNCVLREMLIERVLPAYNAEFVEAGTVAEARAALNQQEFTAAVLDIRLTNGDGIELFRWIMPQWPRLKVVFLTGYNSPDHREEIEKIGPAFIFDKNRMTDFDFVEKLMAQFGVTKKAL